MKKFVAILFLLSLLVLPQAKAEGAYDGLWFMGFNMDKDLFGDKNGLLVRQAFNLAINRSMILKIISESVLPTGVIPPGMLGYDSNFKGYSYNISAAKKLMKKAGYTLSDKRLKYLTLLHTDGDKTIKIAEQIKRDLINLGVNLGLKQIPFKDQDFWTEELGRGRSHLFLMGYKTQKLAVFIGDKTNKVFHTAICPQLPEADKQEYFNSFSDAIGDSYKSCTVCKPSEDVLDNPFDLITALFSLKGSANFTFYSNPKVDSLLNLIQGFDPSSKEAISIKCAEINKILTEDPPAVNLFYIPTL